MEGYFNVFHLIALAVLVLLSMLFMLISRGDERSNVAEVTASVAKNIAPKQIRNFSISMPYPSYFTNTQTITKLECR